MVLPFFRNVILALGVLSAPLAAEDAEKKAPTKEELFSDTSIDRLSETYGHFIAKSLNNPVLKLNAKAVIQGIQDGIAGKASPMTEEQYEEALGLIQKFAYEDMSNKNLAEAESLLKKNSTEEGVVLLEDGKVQYKVLQPGSGEEVTEETMPTINYSATYSNGQKIGSSEQTGGPIDVNLNDTIPGFRKGILGMKVGEKRLILIHPDLGFGKSGQLPNGLLIFEVEVVKLQPKPAKDEAESEDDDVSQMLADGLLLDDEDDDDDDLGDELESGSLEIDEYDDEDDDDDDDVPPPPKKK